MIKKLIIVICAAMLCAFCLLGCGIKQTADRITVEAGQKLNLKAEDFFNIKAEKAAEVRFDTSEVNTEKPGEYEVIAYYGKESFLIKVEVEDTTAPSVELKQHYGFTNDIAAYDVSKLVDGIYDASDYTLGLARFEKSGELCVLDEIALKRLTDAIPLPGDQTELASLGQETVPKEEGIYRAVLEAKDAYGNIQLEEVIIILDKTGALIEDMPDQIVEQEDITKVPEINAADYVVTDNVDGVIPAKEIQTEVTRKDAENAQYNVHVSYTDRAGNMSTGDFLVIVTEKSGDSQANTENGKEPVIKNENSDSGKGDAGSSKGDSGTASESSGEGNKDSGLTENGSSENNTDEGESSNKEAGEPEQEAKKPDVQMYTVIADNGGYSVFVNGSEEAGKGDQLLMEYLNELGYDCTQISGGWYDKANNIYNCFVSGNWIIPSASEDWED